MIVAQIINLYTKAIDFVLAFTQGDLDVPVYMELPSGMELAGNGKDGSKYLIKLKKSLYGLKNTSLSWYNNMKDALRIEVLWSLYQTHMSSSRRI